MLEFSVQDSSANAFRPSIFIRISTTYRAAPKAQGFEAEHKDIQMITASSAQEDVMREGHKRLNTGALRLYRIPLHCTAWMLKGRKVAPRALNTSELYDA